MALVTQETVAGFSSLPPLRQIGLMIGLAASVAIGVAVVLWSQTPNFSLLYANLAERDTSQIMQALDKAGIPYKLDAASGALLVPAGEVHKARLQLASSGLPRGNGSGFELLEKESGFGTSQFIENARYQRALEHELGTTIAGLRNVESARVHLALPKRSVFIGRKEQPSASVVVNLYPGRTLDDGQVAAVVHLVAGSVPRLDPRNVTVVDQAGNLLTSHGNDQVGMTSSQFAYTRKLEQSYVRRIEDLLSPMVGAGGVRAQVTADLDFTVSERTEESYNPDRPALRSEQTSEETLNGVAAAFGVPGTLSNQPPGGGVAPEQAGQLPADATGAEQPAGNRSKRSVRNFELDRTITHTRAATGAVRRLSVAVVLDNKQIVNDKGETVREPWSAEELATFTKLVREAVGFQAERGDTVEVINVPFQPPAEVEPLPEPPIWEQPWVWTLLKQLAGAVGVLVLIFGVLKPVLRNLSAVPRQQMVAAGAGGQQLPEGESGLAEDQVSLGGPAASGNLPPPGANYEEQINTARTLAQQDPKRVAQVMKNWVSDDG